MTSHMRPSPPGPAPDRESTLGLLVRRLGSDAALLIRQEITLARAELRQPLRHIAGAVSRLSIGAGILLLAGLTVLFGVVVLLGALIGEYWIGALIVGLVFLGAGGWLALREMHRLRALDPTPRETVDSLQDTAKWARNEVARVRASLRTRSAGAQRPMLKGAEAQGARGRPPADTDAASRPRHAPGRPGGRAIRARSSTAVASPYPSAGTGGRDAAGSGVQANRQGGDGQGKEPPPRREGTWPFLKHVAAEIKEDEVAGHAAKVAYYAFLAMPPALMAVFGLAGLVGSERLAMWLERQSAIAMPAAVSEGIVGPFIEQVVLQKAPGPFSIGLLLALWGGSSVFMGLMSTLNHAYDVKEGRSFVKQRAIALTIMIGSVALFLLAAGALLAGPAIVRAIGLGPAGELAWNILQWPLAFAFMVAAFWFGYYFLPDRNQSACRVVLIKAAALAAALWVLATAAFRVYIANFASYSETYGFLGAFIILLLWLYMTGIVVLAGGELASEMEKRAA